MLRFAGLRDIVAGTVDSPWPRFSVESLLAYDPDIIVTARPEMADSMRSMPGIKDMRAVRNNRIIVMPKETDSPALALQTQQNFCATPSTAHRHL